MDEIITPNLAALVCEQVRDFIIRQRVNMAIKGDTVPLTQPRDNSFEPLGRDEKNFSEAQSVSTSTADESIAADLAKVEAAFDRQVLYIIGKEQLRVKAGTKLWRKILLSAFLWIRENTRTKVANLTVDTSKVVEIGFVKDV
jgi:KUP system potassium uptake protein